MRHTLELDSIQLSFGERVILSDIFMKCETGKIIALLGRNGQGKTCLLNVVYGELEPQNKSVRFDKKPIAKAFKRPDLIKYLPQFNYIPERLSVKRVFDDFELDFSEFSDRYDEFRPAGNRKIAELPGGQRRFLETYIVVKSKTQFVILDEPFTHLMPLQIEKMTELILEEKGNKGFIITDHLYEKIVWISDDLYVLKSGKTHLIKNASEIGELGYAPLISP